MTLLSVVSQYGVRAIFAVLAVGAAILVVGMLQIAGAPSLSKLYRPDPVPDIQHPQFSSDESKLAFNVCHPCRVAICSVTTQKTAILSPGKGSMTFDATFDPISDKVAFVLSQKLSSGDWDYQIATSQPDGSGLKVLTSSDTQKRSPKYAFDGSKILFEAKGRCPRDRTEYCGADAYEFDIDTKQERRLTDLQALQIAPVSFLPGNSRIALTAYGSAKPRGRERAERVDIEKDFGDKRRVFVVAIENPDRLFPITTGTPTATSPMALPSGEIAFTSRVNEYDGVKAGYRYDVFIHGPTGTRRHTKISRYVRDYGISNSTQSVAFVVETSEKPPKAELLIWSAVSGQTRDLQCDKFVEERPLVP